MEHQGDQGPVAVEDEVPEKKCSRCGERPPRPRQRYCAGCHAEYQRTYRANTKKRIEEEIARRVMEQLAAERQAADRARYRR